MKTQKRDVLITIALVVHNQSDILSNVVKEITQTLRKAFRYFEILIIDNGSTDDTFGTIETLLKKNPSVRALVLSRQYDTEIGYMAVLENSIGDFVVLLNAETDPPTFIPTLIRTAQQGFDIVKTTKRQKNTMEHLRIPEQVFVSLYKHLLNYDVLADTSDFLIFSRHAVNALTLFKNKHRFLHYLNATIGFRQCTLEYQPVSRHRGKMHTPSTITSFHRLFDMTISNSTFPLRFAAFVGMSASFLSLLYLLYTFVVAMVKKKIAEGWLTTSVLNASMFFLLFIILTILVEYIDRLIHETKEQPTYIISEELSSSNFSTRTKHINVI